MRLEIFADSQGMAKAAAEHAVQVLTSAIEKSGRVAFIAATGASQFEFLDILTAGHSIEWSKATMFHLDEYVGIPETHPASFRRYLKERLIEKVQPGDVYLVNGEVNDPVKEVHRLNAILSRYDIDVAFVGVGENGHLAFNDPPADFEAEDPFIVVNLDSACRRQQVGEGWFSSVEEVPPQAISMSVKQIMRARTIIANVPGFRKAQAIKDCFGDEEVSPLNPASILKQHPNAHIYLDRESASLLEQ
ncbi:MAG: glucosamine-6-phosphate deaminase [Fidelibacterota bacterium]|nr:MAG: glucosamine-6-phosphate deaminase [Candidatus Neomarinimicrobiota bacterium]